MLGAIFYHFYLRFFAIVEGETALTALVGFVTAVVREYPEPIVLSAFVTFDALI